MNLKFCGLNHVVVWLLMKTKRSFGQSRPFFLVVGWCWGYQCSSMAISCVFLMLHWCRRCSVDRAASSLIPGVKPYLCSLYLTQDLSSIKTVRVLSGPSLCEVDVDGWLRGSKVARVKVCTVWPPAITNLRARNKMSAVRTGQQE